MLFVAWSFFLRAKPTNRRDDGYTIQDYAQDASRIYFDLGKFAQTRNDWETAIKFYKMALSLNQNFQPAVKHLEMCLNLQNQSSAFS